MKKTTIFIGIFILIAVSFFFFLFREDSTSLTTPESVRVSVDSGRVQIDSATGTQVLNGGEKLIALRDGSMQVIAPTPVSTKNCENDIASTSINSVTVEGLIVDEEGQAYADASMRIVSSSDSEQSVVSHPVDRYGQFHTVLSAGEYLLEATAPQALIATERKYRIAVNPFPPQDFVLPRQRQVSGAVLNEASQPIAAATLQLFAEHDPEKMMVVPATIHNASIQYETVSESKGKYCFTPVWPGSYNLSVTADGYLPHRETNVSTTQKHRTIVLKTNAVLHVKVTDLNEKPLMTAKVNLRQIEGEGLIAQTAETSQKGECTFRDLTPGGYQVSASCLNYTNTDSALQTVKIESDEEFCTLQLQRMGLSISGRVVEYSTKNPVPDFHIQIAPTQFESESIAQTKTDSEGKFRFDNIPPGTYKIYEDWGGKGNETNEFTIPDGIVYKTEVTLNDQNLEGVEVPAFRKANISGFVYSADKKPVVGAFLFILGSRTTSNRDGSFRFYSPGLNVSLVDGKPVVEERKEKIEAFHMDYGVGYSEELTYRSGTKIEGIQITLNGLGDLNGIVVNSNQEPIAQASITWYGKPSQYTKQAVSDTNGRFTLTSICLQNTFLEVEAEHYVKKTVYLKHPLESKSAEERIELTREEDDAGISGIVVDNNGEPIPEVTITMMSTFRRYKNEWRDEFEYGISGFTEADGRFHLNSNPHEQNLQDKTYVIRFRMTTEPFLTQDIYNVRAGTKDLLVRLVFQPVEVRINIDDSALRQSVFGEPYALRVIPQNNTQIPVFVLTIKSGETQSLFLTEPGNYQINAEGKTGTSEQNIQITEETAKVLPVTIVLNPAEDRIQVTGLLTNMTEGISKRPIRVRIQSLNSGTSFLDEIAVVSTAPEKEYTFSVPNGGDYKVEFINFDNQLFHRLIVSISSADADPQTGAVRLPDVPVPLYSSNE